MDYYIQGDAANADQIKAAFEAKAIQNGSNLNFTKEDRLFYSCDGKVNYCSNSGGLANIIKTHPDYKELELPKPHYDIANFNPFDKVLGRNCRSGVWRADYFSHIHKNGKLFVGIAYTWEQCIPFNDDTKHLLGTTDMPSEEYINW